MPPDSLARGPVGGGGTGAESELWPDSGGGATALSVALPSSPDPTMVHDPSSDGAPSFGLQVTALSDHFYRLNAYGWGVCVSARSSLPPVVASCEIQ